MPVITDDAAFAAFRDALVWRPIAEYDRARGLPQLLRNGSACALGFWGPATLPDWTPEERGPTWRHAQDSSEEVPLGFEPQEFAVVDDDWRARLTED